MSDQIVRTACPAHDGNACGLLVHVRDGRVDKLEPADFPDKRMNRICIKALAMPEMVYHPDRLRYPLKRVGARGEGRWERISWDQALNEVAGRLTDVAAIYGSPSVGWVLGGPGTGTVKFGVYTRLAALFQGTRVSCWGYGDAAVPCGGIATLGSHFPVNHLEWPSGTSLNIVWGTNPGESAPFRMRPLLDAKERGGRLVVIDPVFTVTASKADEYVGIRPGTDVALALGLINIIMRSGKCDEDFIRRSTVGPFLVREDNGLFLRERDLGTGGSAAQMVWDAQSQTSRVADACKEPAILGRYTVSGIRCATAFQHLYDLAMEYPPERVAGICEVTADTVRRLAEVYAVSKPVSIHFHHGLARTYHGDISLKAIIALAAITGNIVPPGPSAHSRAAVLNWEPFLNPMPGTPGYSRMPVLNMYDAISLGKPYPIKAAWFAFINFVNQCSNNNRIIKELIPNLDFIVVADMFMTTTAHYADIVLPTCSYLEHSDLVQGPSSYLQLQQKVIEPLYESRSDTDIVRGLAKRLGFEEYFKPTEEEFIDIVLNSGHPTVSGITRAKLRGGAMKVDTAGDEDRREARFRTPSGRVEFYVEGLRKFGESLPVFKEPREGRHSPLARKYPLVFVQVHSRFRTHSMFANSPSLLELNPEPVIEINPADASARGISDGDMVIVFNDRGRVKLKAKLNPGMHPGVVNIKQGWWPKQFAEGSFNSLTSDAINPAQEAVYEPNMPMNDALVEVLKVE